MGSSMDEEAVRWDCGTTIRYARLLSKEEIKEFLTILYPDAVKIKVRRRHFYRKENVIIFRIKIWHFDGVCVNKFSDNLFLNDFKYDFEKRKNKEDVECSILTDFMTRKYGGEYIKFQVEFCEPRF